MMRLPVPRRTPRSARRGAILCAACVALALVLGHRPRAQEDSPPRRVKSAAPALAGIDLGLASDAVILKALATPRPKGDDGGPAYAPGRVLVKFREGASSGSASTARAQAARIAGARTITTPDYANFEVLQIDPASDAEAIARQLAAQPEVEYAQPDYLVKPDFTPNDPDFGRQWHFSALGFEQAWEINRGASSSIIVAVIDTGVAFENAVFTYDSRVVRTPFFLYPSLGRVSIPFAAAPDLGTASRFASPRDFIWGDDDPVDLDGHGTHVAGTIGQLTDNGAGGAGIAFNVRIMPVKVLVGNWDIIFGAPTGGSDSIVAQGVRYAVDNGARVLNMSLGRSGPASAVIEDALRYAVGRGAFVALSGGNDFEEGNPDHRPADVGPKIPGVMTVGAVGRDLNRAYYSQVKPYIEIAAPGGNVQSGGTAGLVLQQSYDPVLSVPDPLDSRLPPNLYRAPRFDVFVQRPSQGTSMAAPHVAGFAALLMQQGITSPAAIEAAITRYATDRGAAGRDDEYGAGLINPRDTLRGLGLSK